MGYRPYSYDPASRSLTEVVPGRRRGGNMLLISDANLVTVRGRLENADRPPLRAPSVSWR